MPCPQERCDLVRHRLKRHAVSSRDRDVLQMRDAEQLLLHRRVRHHDRVVLIGTHGCLALSRQNADDPKRLIADPNRRARRVNADAEELIPGDASEDGDLLRAGDILVGEERSLLDRPGADRRQIGAGSLNLCVPVGRFRHDLLTGVDPG